MELFWLKYAKKKKIPFGIEVILRYGLRQRMKLKLFRSIDVRPLFTPDGVRIPVPINTIPRDELRVLATRLRSLDREKVRALQNPIFHHHHFGGLRPLSISMLPHAHEPENLLPTENSVWPSRESLETFPAEGRIP